MPQLHPCEGLLNFYGVEPLVLMCLLFGGEWKEDTAITKLKKDHSDVMISVPL